MRQLNNSLSRPINARLFLHRQILPYAVKIGSPTLRRRLLELLPFDLPKTAMKISDIVMKCARDILHEKIQNKDEEEPVHIPVGRGKDILSVLCKVLPSDFFRWRH